MSSIFKVIVMLFPESLLVTYWWNPAPRINLNIFSVTQVESGSTKPQRNGRTTAHLPTCHWINYWQENHPPKNHRTCKRFSREYQLPNSFMGVSQNNGSPKSSILIGFSIINHYKPSILGYPYFWKHPYRLMVLDSQLGRSVTGKRSLAESNWGWICSAFTA